MRNKKSYGYHIANSVVNPRTMYLGKDDIYVPINFALHFLDHKHARDYAKQKGIKIGDVHNVIVPCECDDSIRKTHTSTNEYY